MSLLRTRISSLNTLRRNYASVASNVVRIVEVGPRDGLQNEKGVIPVSVKVDLINRLGDAGMKTIEAGSFVSPKWVPQMAGTAEILQQMNRLPSVHYPILVPNQKGLDLLNNIPNYVPDEISIFTAATNHFTKANTNSTIEESLARLRPVTQAALDKGIRVRGYVSVVIACPYSGSVDPTVVKAVTKELLDMGCYEVSLGDTVGQGTPAQVSTMLEEVLKVAPAEKLAGHFHDTYGTAVANVFRALEHGIRVIDTSVGGLGGCPYSPGATGNVATEDVVYALTRPGSQYAVEEGVNLEKLVNIGGWISQQLGRDNASRAGKAILARRARDEAKDAKAKL